MGLTRRMLGREVQGREVVEVVFNVWAIGDGKAHLGKDGGHLIHHLHGRMDTAPTARRRRQGQVETLSSQLGIKGCGFQRGLALGQGGLNPITQAIDQRPLLAAFIGAHRPEPLQQG